MRDYHLHSLIIIILFIFFVITNSLSAVTVSLLPQPKKMSLKNTEIAVGPKSQINISKAINNRFKSVIDSLRSSLGSLPETENNLPIKVDVMSKRVGNRIANDIVSSLNRQEGYVIEVNGNSIKVTGADELGALHGLTTLEKLIIDRNGKILQGKIIDWPDHKIRALHLVLRNTKPEGIKQIIKNARFGHYNTLILALADGIRLSTMEHVSKNDAWTKNEFSDVVTFARENGLEVIPELILLTHQGKLLKEAYPHLMFNKATYDPRKEETYATVLPMIDEVIDLIKPKAFHIGHDEVAGFKPWSKKKWLGNDEEMLPPELFLKDVERLHAHLKKRGVETWMWGDMLISPEEFPTMLDKHLHGAYGYAALRNKIPKDIVICDWHYNDGQTIFPSASAFANAGHKVLGAVWKKEKTIKNFSRYIAKMPSGGEGMIATTWFHVQRKEWDVVENIMRISAEAFWNAK